MALIVVREILRLLEKEGAGIRDNAVPSNLVRQAMLVRASIEEKMGVYCMFIYFPNCEFMLCITSPRLTFTVVLSQKDENEKLFLVEIPDPIQLLCQRIFMEWTTAKRELSEDYGGTLLDLIQERIALMAASQA